MLRGVGARRSSAALVFLSSRAEARYSGIGYGEMSRPECATRDRTRGPPSCPNRYRYRDSSAGSSGTRRGSRESRLLCSARSSERLLLRTSVLGLHQRMVRWAHLERSVGTRRAAVHPATDSPASRRLLPCAPAALARVAS